MRTPTLLFALAVLAWVTWLATQPLWVVSRSGPPRPLAIAPEEMRDARALDVVVPMVPIGLARLRDGHGVMVVHYWAPWQRHARVQAAALDSLRRLPGLETVEVTLACGDPFPSVARFVARQRLRLRVVIDGSHALRDALPCPSVPYTWVLDARGRVAAAQAGEIDWLSPATRDALRALGAEPGGPAERAPIAVPAATQGAAPGSPPDS